MTQWLLWIFGLFGICKISVLYIYVSYNITVAACDGYVPISNKSMYNELQGILTSSYTPMNPVEGTCSIRISCPITFAIRLELLHSSGVRSAKILGDATEMFSPSAKTGETVLARHIPYVTPVRIRTLGSAVFIISYEGEGFIKLLNSDIIKICCYIVLVI